MLTLPSRRSILTGLVLTPALAVMPHGAWAVPEGEGADLPAASNTPISLSHAARSGGRYYGAAARADHLREDKALRAAVLRDCAVLTPEIHLKWNSLEWRKGQFNFAPVDDLLAFSDENGLRVRGHTLLWDQSTPDWAKREMLEHRDWRLMSEHFSRVLGRYGGRAAPNPGWPPPPRCALAHRPACARRRCLAGGRRVGQPTRGNSHSGSRLAPASA